MQAVILAAGLGKRLKEYTKDVPKCMVTVNGVTMIERLLRQLDDKGLSGVTIVTGYKERHSGNMSARSGCQHRSHLLTIPYMIRRITYIPLRLQRTGCLRMIRSCLNLISCLMMQ